MDELTAFVTSSPHLLLPSLQAKHYTHTHIPSYPYSRSSSLSSHPPNRLLFSSFRPFHPSFASFFGSPSPYFTNTGIWSTTRLSASASSSSSALSDKQQAWATSAEERAAFSAVADGEWTGYEAFFDADSMQVIAVPEFELPETFLDWSLRPAGYESYQSVKLRGTTLWRKHKRLLPASTSSIDEIDFEEEIFRHDLIQAGNVVVPGGGYVIAPEILEKRKDKWANWPKIEVALMPKQKQRIVIRFPYDADAFNIPAKVQIIIEDFEDDFNDGAALFSSNGFVDGFADEDPIQPYQLKDFWNPSQQLTHGITLTDPPKPTANKYFYFPRGLSLFAFNDDDKLNAFHVACLTEDKKQRIGITILFDKQGNLVDVKHFLINKN